MSAHATCDACNCIDEMFFVPNRVWNSLEESMRQEGTILCWDCFFAAYCLSLSRKTKVAL